MGYSKVQKRDLYQAGPSKTHPPFLRHRKFWYFVNIEIRLKITFKNYFVVNFNGHIYLLISISVTIKTVKKYLKNPFNFIFTFTVSSLEKSGQISQDLSNIWQYVTAIADKIFEPVKNQAKVSFLSILPSLFFFCRNTRH